jgi:hypothetical protein
VQSMNKEADFQRLLILPNEMRQMLEFGTM